MDRPYSPTSVTASERASHDYFWTQQYPTPPPTPPASPSPSPSPTPPRRIRPARNRTIIDLTGDEPITRDVRVPAREYIGNTNMYRIIHSDDEEQGRRVRRRIGGNGTYYGDDASTSKLSHYYDLVSKLSDLAFNFIADQFMTKLNWRTKERDLVQFMIDNEGNSRFVKSFSYWIARCEAERDMEQYSKRRALLEKERFEESQMIEALQEREAHKAFWTNHPKKRKRLRHSKSTEPDEYYFEPYDPDR